MNRTELEELIRNGENSGLEFKRDDVVPERLAKELAALLNLEGGHLLLGVEDDGTVTGLTRAPKQVEEWIMEVARVHLRAVAFWPVERSSSACHAGGSPAGAVLSWIAVVGGRSSSSTCISTSGSALARRSPWAGVMPNVLFSASAPERQASTN